MSSELRSYIATEDISHGSLCWVLSRNSKARHQTFVLRVVVILREFEIFETEDSLHDIFLFMFREDAHVRHHQIQQLFLVILRQLFT